MAEILMGKADVKKNNIKVMNFTKIQLLTIIKHFFIKYKSKSKFHLSVLFQISFTTSDILHIKSSALIPPNVRVVQLTFQVKNILSLNVTMLNGPSKVFSHQV